MAKPERRRGALPRGAPGHLRRRPLEPEALRKARKRPHVREHHSPVGALGVRRGATDRIRGAGVVLRAGGRRPRNALHDRSLSPGQRRRGRVDVRARRPLLPARLRHARLLPASLGRIRGPRPRAPPSGRVRAESPRAAPPGLRRGARRFLGASRGLAGLGRRPDRAARGRRDTELVGDQRLRAGGVSRPVRERANVIAFSSRRTAAPARTWTASPPCASREDPTPATSRASRSPSFPRPPSTRSRRAATAS